MAGFRADLAAGRRRAVVASRTPLPVAVQTALAAAKAGRPADRLAAREVALPRNRAALGEDFIITRARQNRVPAIVVAIKPVGRCCASIGKDYLAVRHRIGIGLAILAVQGD